MTAIDRDAPCQTCGSRVRHRRQAMERSIVDVSAPVEDIRVCTNAECPTNGRDKSLTDVV